MKFKVIFLVFIVSILSYILSPSLNYLLNVSNIHSLRIQLMYITGSMGIIFMSVAVIISARFSFVNKIFGGLDKAYDVHRITGAIGFFLGVLHLLLLQTNKLLISLQILEAPAKSANPLKGVILDLYKACYAYVEPAFYLMIIIVLFAIIKIIPYYYFIITHKLIPILYLFVAFHSFMAPFRSSWQLTIGGSIMHIIIIAGTICAFISIFNLTGIMNRYKGMIKSKKLFDDKIIQLEIQLQNDKEFKYNYGQFVFLKFSYTMEAHPFSVAGWDINNKVLTFYIKQSGDFTNQLYDKISVGDKLLVEGPYGEFSLQSAKKQIWIAGGIGITPFLSKLNSLSDNNEDIELIYSYEGKSPFEDMIKKQCVEKNIKLHIIDSKKGGKLTFDKIMEIAPDITSSSIYFCGPVMFRKTIEDGMKKNNKAFNDFHYDNFSFR